MSGLRLRRTSVQALRNVPFVGPVCARLDGVRYFPSLTHQLFAKLQFFFSQVARARPRARAPEGWRRRRVV